MQEHRTSVEWWQRTKASRPAFEAWLYKQYRGEVTAASRIEALRDAFLTAGTRAHRLLTVIAGQERRHALWVAELLRARGLDVHVEAVESRYFGCTIPEVVDFETGAAIGAHSEQMRLARIELIAADAEADVDVRTVFRRILPDERFHARAFRSLAGPAALKKTEGAHDLGRRALGLVP
jgi:rubrerythrin